ncbi:MAG: glycosyltransferase [Anaerolineae bacterium]|nr:glycosyltransferase [Anaerolineae bacterium]
MNNKPETHPEPAKHTTGDRLAILVPAYNEAARVADVVTAAREYLPVLVVDDGSTDDTAARAEAAGAIVQRQSPNQGKGAALLAGFRWALDQGYDAVIMLDADGQHDPAEIPAFLDAYAARQPDLIIGERNFRQMPFPRNISNTIGRWLFAWALGQPVRDNQSGYRLVSRRLMEATFSSSEHGFEFEVDMIVTCVTHGCRLEGVPIRTIYAGETSHIQPWHHLTNYLRVIRRTRRVMKRTRRDTRQGEPLRWLPLLLLPLIGIGAAALIIITTSDSDDSRTSGAITFASPPPVTFVPPTLLPTSDATAVPPQASVLDKQVPDISLTTLEGNTIRLRDMAASADGQIVFLNFWATWCEPCRREMPALQAAQDDHDNVTVLAVNIETPAEASDDAIRAFLDRYGLSLTVARYTQPVLQDFGVVQIPITYVIDRDGIVRFRHIGALDGDAITTYLNEMDTD